MVSAVQAPGGCYGFVLTWASRKTGPEIRDFHATSSREPGSTAQTQVHSAAAVVRRQNPITIPGAQLPSFDFF